MTAFNNAPNGATIIKFPAGRVRRSAERVGAATPVADFMLAQAKSRVDFEGSYHEAAIKDEWAQRGRG